MTTAASSPAAIARSPWFRSAPFDLVLILGVPFLTWPLVMAAQRAWGPGLLSSLILLTATGHYFATFVRAYGDRELFARFRTRFLLAPPLLLATCVGLLSSGHQAALLLVTAGWAFWHWLAQAFGFARIYDIKAGSFRPLTAWLDKALVIAGFAGTVTLNDGAVAMFGKLFLDAGLPLPSSAAFAVVQAVVRGVLLVVGVGYVANLAYAIVRGQPWSWQKHFMNVTTIGYYWFAFAWLPNVLIAHVLYELFHDVQYYAITWITCGQRVRRPGIAPWFARMFRPGFVAALGFVAVMTAFGALDLFARDAAPELLGAFLAAALLHYYYDGFIWKAREGALGRDLGIQAGLAAAVVPGLRHAARWGLFGLPLLATLALGGGELDARQRAEALVAVAPGDFLSQAELGFELTRSRELPAALEHYRASIAANPDYAAARTNFGAALDLQGDTDAAREQYEAALRCQDQGGAHHQAHVNLGVLSLLAADAAGAGEHLRAAGPDANTEAIGRMLGLAAAVPASAVERRLRLYRGVLQLDAQVPEAHFALGDLLLQQRRFDEAQRHFRSVLSRSPQHVPSLLGLAGSQCGLGDLAAGRATLQQVLQLDPQNPQALALRARLGG